MLIDLTLKIKSSILEVIPDSEKMDGHFGTHFDVMNKIFPLEYTERKAIVFDVSNIKERDIQISDIDIEKVEKDMFIAFYSGFLEKEGYASKTYFSAHPQLSNELIDELIKRKISIIGVDFAGIRRGSEHTPKDQYCADSGVFIIENLCNLGTVILNCKDYFIANTYPMNYTDITGLPCRVIAKL